MRTSRLNRSGIRRRTIRLTDEPTRDVAAVRSANDSNGAAPGVGGLRRRLDPKVSRRGMLGISTTALVASSPILRGARSLLSEGYRVKGDEQRLVFSIGRRNRWVIEPKVFGSTARLSIDRTKNRLRLQLTNARYPGTDLPADFTCEITGEEGGRSKFRMHLAAFDVTAKGVFEEWLLGLKPLEGKTKKPATLLDTDLHLASPKGSELRFAPDWSIAVEGKKSASLDRFGTTRLDSDIAVLRLPTKDDETIVEGRGLQRTRISLFRDDHDWTIEPDARDGKGWNLETPINTFDRIEIEGAEKKGGSRSLGVVAEGEGGAAFAPTSGRLTDSKGNPFRLPLERPVYATESSDDGRSSLFVASYPERSTTMKGSGFGVRLGEGKPDEVLEIAATDGELDTLICAPTIRAISLPLDGAVVAPARPKQQQRLHFFRHLMPHPHPDDDDPDADVELDDEQEAIVTFPMNTVVWVLRPADMLYLGFEFINLNFSSGKGSKGKTKGFRLSTTNLKGASEAKSINRVKAAPVAEQIPKFKGPVKLANPGGGSSSNKPYLVVHFPPQNIAEQAFWEAEDTHDEEAPEGKEAPPGGSEKPDLPPVQHRIAGPSRLAFALPKEVTELPYTLADLLDWSSLVPSVAPVALPPPPPPSRAVGSLIGLTAETRGKIAMRSSGNPAARRLASGRSDDEEAAASKYGNITLKRGYISSGSSGAASGGAPKARSAADAVAASSPSIRADHSQLNILKTENAASKIGLYLDLVAKTPEIAEPKDHQTAIETPYRLILSPHIYSGWAHAIEPVTHNGVSELWHTRLGVRKSNGAIDEYDDYYRTVRAIWSPDYSKLSSPPSDNFPFRMSLNARDRHELVRLSSDYGISDYIPDPVSVQSLMLSPLGAWMNTRGNWEPPNDQLSIEEWKHRGTMGRDHYVRVVYKGFLFPFGNRASLIKITERKIRKFSRGGYIAYMYQRMYIVVRKPEMDFPALAQPYDGRRTPFRSVRLTTLVTPNLDQPDVGKSKIAGYGDEAFWPVVAGEDFIFNVVATDWEGKEVELSTPLAFVNNKHAFTHSKISDVAATYSKGRRTRDLDGQTLAYAPSDKEGDTDFETEYVEFWYDAPTSDTGTTADASTVDGNAMYPHLVASDDDMYDADQPYFYPAFVETKVRIDAVEQVTGTEAFRAIKLHPAFYKHGISGNGNKGQVFAELVESVELSFNTNADKAGGVATPNMGIAGLSRSLGTVGGKVEDAVKGEFDPSSFFDEALDANLLGGISLKDIIGAVGDFAGDILKIPQLVNKKNFQDPKSLVSTLQSVATLVDDVKGDIEKFQELADEIDEAIGDINSIPDAATQAAEDAAEAARQKALAVIKAVEAEAKGIINQAKGYAESLVNKVKSIAESESLVDLLEAFGLPTEFNLELKWGPMIKSWPNSNQPNDLMGTNALFQTLNASGVPVEQSDEVIYIRAAITVKLDGSPPSFTLEGVANNFVIRLVPIKDVAPEGFVHLRMTDLSFRSKDASKVDVNVEFDPDEGFKFAGPLAFVEKIREFIPFDGFSDPPSLDISPTGVVAGFTFPIPTIAVGIFSLQNISLGASLELPFTNSPIVFTFLFCTRENPFVLTVSMFGGGGFFGLIISTKEIGIEAALEFGANIAFDVGVASGGVYVMAGVYFKKMGEECILEGYLKLGGHLSVLGIISISIDLYMSLTYQDPGGKVHGQATLTFEVEVLFFSVSFSKTIERRFKGSENDPLFIDLMGQDDWTEYCEAFA